MKWRRGGRSQDLEDRRAGEVPADGGGDPTASWTGPGEGKVPRLLRPRGLTYADAEIANFECAGPSLRFTFSDGGRAFQAHIWLNRRAADPQIRAQAIEILNGFRARQPENEGSVEEEPAGRESAVVRCDSAFLTAGSAGWREEATQVGG